MGNFDITDCENVFVHDEHRNMEFADDNLINGTNCNELDAIKEYKKPLTDDEWDTSNKKKVTWRNSV